MFFILLSFLSAVATVYFFIQGQGMSETAFPMLTMFFSQCYPVIHIRFETWIMMIGFRNTIIHDYLDIDRHIVFDVLHNNLKDFREFEVIFAKFL